MLPFPVSKILSLLCLFHFMSLGTLKPLSSSSPPQRTLYDFYFIIFPLYLLYSSLFVRRYTLYTVI